MQQTQCVTIEAFFDQILTEGPYLTLAVSSAFGRGDSCNNHLDQKHYRQPKG